MGIAILASSRKPISGFQSILFTISDSFLDFQFINTFGQSEFQFISTFGQSDFEINLVCGFCSKQLIKTGLFDDVLQLNMFRLGFSLHSHLIFLNSVIGILENQVSKHIYVLENSLQLND